MLAGSLIQLCLRPRSGGHRLFDAAGAAGGVAIAGILIFLSASPAGAAVRDPSVCQLLPGPSILWGDPEATYPSIGGYYKRVENIGYKITGEFPHSATLAWTAYDDYGFVPSEKNVLEDHAMVPDHGSVNPFRVGSKVNATRRSYTAWLWPDSEPVPSGLHNVILFPTKPTDPTDTRVRFSMLMRMYQMQPGYHERQFYPTIRAVSTATRRALSRCPLSRRADLGQITASFARWNRDWGPGQLPPPATDDRLLFSRPPARFVPYPEGYASDGAGGYFGSRIDLSKISVVTMHDTPTHFNNHTLRPSSVMGDYQARYMSLTVLHFPSTGPLSVNSSNAIYQPDGSWVTVFLPSEPRLPPDQVGAARAKAKQLGYNVIQLPRPNKVSSVVPEQLALRMKVPNPKFCCSVDQVPSWVDPNNPGSANNNYRDWDKPKDASFFSTYTSNSANMGPYYIDGVRESYSAFMQRSPPANTPSWTLSRVFLQFSLLVERLVAMKNG